MANSTKTSSKKSSSTSSKSSSSSSRKSFWGINKISFYCIGAAAILYLVGAILSLAGLSFTVVTILQNVAMAIMVTIVSVLAWRYVRSKQTVWKILYIVFLLVIILGIILPLVK